MPSCFIIQPFDSGKFDKRFTDIYKPALEHAGLEAYRVDEDNSVVVPIDAIEQGIIDSDLCLADITTDNPNVWYELGFAFATGCPVIMVCSNERKSNYPFDIQHRRVIEYASESTSDFSALQKKITQTAESLLKKTATLRQVAQTDQVASQEGLSQHELLVLAIIAGDTAIPDSATSPYSLQRDAERGGLTPLAFGLAYRRLIRKRLVELADAYDEQNDEEYKGIQLTSAGWRWIEKNESLFSMKKNHPTPEEFDDEDIPF